jgi:Tfp pilus assembly protein PilO
MTLSRRDKRVLAAGFLIAVGIVAWAYVLSPMQQRWHKAQRMLQADRHELETLQRVAEERDLYGQERDRVLRMVYETPDLAASQRIIPSLINTVQGLGQDCGVTITRYEPLMPRLEEGYAAYTLTLTCQATLSEMVEFLYDLREHRPVIAVTRMHVVPPGEDAKTTDLSVELVVSSYAVQQASDATEDEATHTSEGGEVG